MERFKSISEEYPWVVVNTETYQIIYEGHFKECLNKKGHVMTKNLYHQICQEREINLSL